MQNNTISARDEKPWWVNGCGRLPQGFFFMLIRTICTGSCYWFQQMQMIMCDLSANWNNSYRELEQRILSMEQKLDELSRCFHQTSELLSQVLLRRSSESRWRRRVTYLKKHNRSAKDAFVFVFVFLQVTWVQTQSQIIISSVSIRIHKRQAANPLQPELLQTLNILNHLEDWHTY